MDARSAEGLKVIDPLLANDFMEVLRRRARNTQCAVSREECFDYLKVIEAFRRHRNWDSVLEFMENGPGLCSEVTTDASYCQNIAYMYQGILRLTRADLDLAERLYQESINNFDLFDNNDGRWNKSVAQFGLGLVQLSRGQMTRADKCYCEALLSCRSITFSASTDQKDVERLERILNDRRARLKVLRMQNAEQKPTDAIPVIGRTAAGEPTLALEMPVEEFFLNNWLQLSGRQCCVKAILKPSKGAIEPGPGTSGYYALAVQGESMIDAGINDGDYVIFRSQPTAETGDIVVARIEYPDGARSTVKRFAKKGHTYLLKAENPAYRPQVRCFTVKDPTLAILGKVGGIIQPIG